MLPEIPQMRDSLAALSVEETEHAAPGEAQIVICEKIDKMYPDGSLGPDQTLIVLKQSGSVPIRLNSLIERVADQLHHAGHAHVAPKTIQRASLASIVLAAASILRSSNERARFSNHVLKTIAETRVTQWAVLISPAQEFSKYKFGDFDFGALDTDLLRHRSERAGSDFADLYGDKLRGRLAFCRDHRTIRFANIKLLA